MTRITVASHSDDLATQLRRALADTDGSVLVWPEDLAETGVEVSVERLAAEGPDLVIIGPSPDVDTALVVAEHFDLTHPEVSVLIVADPNAATLERALHAGARGVISPHDDDEDIRALVDRALAAAKRRRVPPPPAGRPTNRVIPVLAAKGGSGKTTVATNLAVSLARQFPGDVLIIDLDLQFGDVASAFGFEPTNTFADISHTRAALNPTALKALLTPRQSEGLYVLAAPDTPAQADDLQPAFVRDVVSSIATEFPYVVIDTPAGIDEFTLEMLDIATDLVVLTSMDVPSVRAARKEIAALEMLGHGHLPSHLVLNRATSKVGLSVEDIESTLGRKIDVKIPSNRQIPLSVNRGEPVSLNDPRSPAGRAFAQLANLTAQVEAGEKSWMRRKRFE